jgi:hypothetical protein
MFFHCPLVAEATELDILPLADVRPGMEGEARTVFQGTTPESFKIRVVSVLRNYLPHQDIVLIEAMDPRVKHTGIAAGMSGSPVYVKGKLVGAIAYGFSSAKDPLAGVTPIEAMLSQANRAGTPDVETSAVTPSVGLLPSLLSGLPQMLPLAVPLAISGMSEPVLQFLHNDLTVEHLVPMRGGGGGGKAGASKAALIPGAAMGVALVRGDLTATAVGTLTCIDGNRVHAFGHPLFGAGQVNLPMVLAEVHAIIPSLVSSIKLASPMGEVGRITDDLKNGIVGVLTGQAKMVPLKVQLTSNQQALRPFSVEIARHRRLLPLLATSVISTALAEAFPDQTDAVADVTTRISVQGFAPIQLRDQFSANEGFGPRILAMAHGPRVLGELLGNPFAPVVIDRIDVAVNLTHRADAAEIVGLASPGDHIRAGQLLPLRVTLRPYGGKEFVRTLTIKIPAGVAGRTIKIEVASGALVKPQVAKPENLNGFMDNLRAFHPASSIVVSMALGEMGTELRGKVLMNLPSSAIDTLRPSQSTRPTKVFKVEEQIVFPSTHVVSGRVELTLHVSSRTRE